MLGEIDGDGCDGDGGLEPIWVSLRTFLATVKVRLEEALRALDWKRRRPGGRRCRTLLHLAEDLGFADDHAVEGAGDAKEVADGFALAELVEVGVGFR